MSFRKDWPHYIINPLPADLDYIRFQFVLLSDQSTVIENESVSKHQDLQLCGVKLSDFQALNIPYPAKLIYLNFHPLEVVCRYCDPQPQVAKNGKNWTNNNN